MRRRMAGTPPPDQIPAERNKGRSSACRSTGGRAAMRKGSYLVWPAKVHIAVGEPIETGGRTLQERDRLIAETRGRIAAMLPS